MTEQGKLENIYFFKKSLGKISLRRKQDCDMYEAFVSYFYLFTDFLLLFLFSH